MAHTDPVFFGPSHPIKKKAGDEKLIARLWGSGKSQSNRRPSGRKLGGDLDSSLGGPDFTWGDRLLAATQTCRDEIDHLIERGTGFAGGFRDKQGMEEADHRGAGAQCGSAGIAGMKFA
jgi:hypothetical protein